jgi:hypothetical protein
VIFSTVRLPHLFFRTPPNARACTLTRSSPRGKHTKTRSRSSWDVAAGSILIEEAGGRITDLVGERWNLRTRKICGSVGGTVHGEILGVLAEAGVV